MGGHLRQREECVIEVGKERKSIPGKKKISTVYKYGRPRVKAGNEGRS
jgi:hypothetical protein